MTTKPGQSVRLLKDTSFTTATRVEKTLPAGTEVEVVRVSDARLQVRCAVTDPVYPPVPGVFFIATVLTSEVSAP